MKVILDNGHGIKTPGKRSPMWNDGSQLFEYEFNRDIVRRVHLALQSAGIESVILVPEIEDISLFERVRRANSIARKHYGSFLISIHANAGGGTGWEAFTSVGQTKSDNIANLLYNEAINKLKNFRIRKDEVDGDFDKESQFYILKNTICPAVLTENMFMDYENDCAFIMSEHGRQVITDLHVDAIRKVFP